MSRSQCTCRLLAEAWTTSSRADNCVSFHSSLNPKNLRKQISRHIENHARMHPDRVGGGARMTRFAPVRSTPRRLRLNDTSMPHGVRAAACQIGVPRAAWSRSWYKNRHYWVKWARAGPVQTFQRERYDPVSFPVNVRGSIKWPSWVRLGAQAASLATPVTSRRSRGRGLSLRPARASLAVTASHPGARHRPLRLYPSHSGWISRPWTLSRLCTTVDSDPDVARAGLSASESPLPGLPPSVWR